MTAAPTPPAYIEPTTGATYPLATPRWCSPAGGPLMITPLPGITRRAIDTACRSLWRYRASLPVAVAEPITLGEGMTPLIARPWRGCDVRFKLEWQSPTGSFKDRGAAVMLSILRQQGMSHVLEDSSGNGGAAVAAYAAAGDMTAKILVPAATQPGKTVQMRAWGLLRPHMSQRWRPQIVSCKARVAASWRATIKTCNAAGRDLRPNPSGQALFCGNPAFQHACAE